MAELPSDAIFDILSRLPVTSVARFRCVSKPWCTYIDDDYFGILHGERAVEEPTPMMYDPSLSCITCFDINKSEDGETTMEAKKVISLESELYKLCSTYLRYVAGVMAELPSNTIFDILSRLPVSCLARFQCVSKTWRAYVDDAFFRILHGQRVVEELTPIKYDPSLSSIACFNIIKSEEGNTSNSTLEAKGLSYKSCYMCREFFVGGSCNGLLYLSSTSIPRTASLAVIHPIRKEFHVLPLMQRGWLADGQSCGLGFDVSTCTFKMVCILSRTDFSKSWTLNSGNLCTMVHVLGMDSSWREIPQVPPYPTSGDGIFAHGCLYWESDCREELICFDVRNEEFTLIYPPKKCDDYATYQLVDLQGEVGYAYYYCDNIIEVWVLKQNQWANHCQFNITESLGPFNHLKVLGRWSKDGDILIENSEKKLFVYSLKSRLLGEVKIVGQEYRVGAFMYMYPESSLFSIRGINKTAHSIKTDLNAG